MSLRIKSNDKVAVLSGKDIEKVRKGYKGISNAPEVV